MTVNLHSSLYSFIATSLLMVGCHPSIKEPTDAKKYCLKDFKAQVEFVEPQTQLITEGIHLTGEVEANPDKIVNYTSLINGIVNNTHFSLGDRVAKGQVLAELKSAELSDMNLQSKSTAEQIKTAQRKLEAVQSMYHDGVASQKELIEAHADLNILKAEKEKVNTNLSLYNANASKGSFAIKAPSSGTVIAKSIANGTQVAAGSEVLFTVADLSEVWVMINVYATDVTSITPGMEVDIKTLSYPNEVFKGKIKTISQLLDKEDRVLKAKVVMDNKNMKLKPGMMVDVMAQKQSNHSALAIPDSALIFDDNQNFVIVYKNDCDITIRKINILLKDNDTVYIQDGLEAGEKIISKNQLLIYELLKNN